MGNRVRNFVGVGFVHRMRDKTANDRIINNSVVFVSIFMGNRFVGF